MSNKIDFGEHVPGSRADEARRKGKSTRKIFSEIGLTFNPSTFEEMVKKVGSLGEYIFLYRLMKAFPSQTPKGMTEESYTFMVEKLLEADQLYRETATEQYRAAMLHEALKQIGEDNHISFTKSLKRLAELVGLYSPKADHLGRIDIFEEIREILFPKIKGNSALLLRVSFEEYWANNVPVEFLLLTDKDFTALDLRIERSFVGFLEGEKEKLSGKKRYVLEKTGEENYKILRSYASQAEAEISMIKEFLTQQEKSVKKPSLSAKTVIERLQKAERVGKRIPMITSGERLRMKFNLRNVQVGNWVSLKELPFWIDKISGGLQDLSDLFEIDPISIGEIIGSLAIGARGLSSTRANAHFEAADEREDTIINLSREKGIGSLAHEFAHALDSYLVYRHTGIAGLMYPNMYRRRDAKKYESIPSFVKLYEFFFRTDSSYFMESAKCESAYYVRSIELFARAFEVYVFEKLKENGHKNLFLTKDEDFYEKDIYVQGEEREMVVDLFDSLMEEIMKNGLVCTKIENKHSQRNAKMAADTAPVVETFESVKGEEYEQLKFVF